MGLGLDYASNEEALDTLVQAIKRAGYKPGRDVAISLDVAAGDLYDEASGKYRFRLEKREFTSDEFADLMIGWRRRYPVISIEDPLADADWKGWSKEGKTIPRYSYRPRASNRSASSMASCPPFASPSSCRTAPRLCHARASSGSSSTACS